MSSKAQTSVLPMPSLAESWLMLIRPRIALMVALMAFLGGSLSRYMMQGATWFSVLEASLYIVLVTGAASVFNQVIERDTDALMKRTQRRPLVTGIVGVGPALTFGLVMGVAGTVGLALRFNMLTALLALATLLLYVVVYTPLKRVSTLNTVVGAIPGAAPPLLGYAALAGDIGPWAWSLFAVLFIWQFPHFMAIAWLYREDYAAAGHRMVPSVPGSAGDAGRQAVIYGLALIPVSLLPLTRGIAGPVYGLGALVLGLVYLWPALRFARSEDRPRARALMFVSLAYLPLLFALILLDPVVRATLAS
ncbi:MAG: protoheme IX farnesyltransferase [Planctomycetota bacterium]|jgi:protoheme IX farnesyltransferase